MKKILKISGIVAAVLLAIAVLFFIWTFIRIKRGDLMKWDNHWYTKEALRAKYPPQVIDVPAKNTPEEVYAKFRQALLDGDIEGALGVMAKKRRAEYRIKFEDEKKLNKFKTLPSAEKIIRSEKDSIGNYASYYYFQESQDQNNEIPFNIEFQKNEYGYWEIEFI